MNPTSWVHGLRARLHMGEHDQKGANLVEYILLIVFIAARRDGRSGDPLQTGVSDQVR